ncbi:hypothetical protein AB4240_23030, partial [Vibrio splendidus]
NSNSNSKKVRGLVDEVYNHVDDRQISMYGKHSMHRTTKALSEATQHVINATNRGDLDAANVFMLIASEVGMICEAHGNELNSYDWNEYENSLTTITNIQNQFFPETA